MSGYWIPAWRDSEYVSLSAVLDALDPVVAQLQWTLDVVDVAPGPGGEALMAMTNSPPRSTRALRDVLQLDGQLIDGVVRGYDTEGRPQLEVRAVDSTSWDFESEHRGIIEAVLRAFPEAEPIPE